MKLFQPRYSKPEGGVVGRSLEKNAEPPLTPVDNADKRAFVAFVSTPQGGLTENHDKSAGSEPPTLPPVSLLATPLESARARLAEYRATYGAQDKQAWQEHLKRAIEAVRDTFPPDRRPYALTHYFKSYGDDAPQVLAVHVIALELWAADKRKRQNGVWLDAAYQAAGLEPVGNAVREGFAQPFRAAAPLEPRHESPARDTGLEPPPPLPAAVVEVLFRHYASDFEPHVRTRLDAIFAGNPPDAIERLQRAADFLAITGDGLADAEVRAMARHCEVN